MTGVHVIYRIGFQLAQALSDLSHSRCDQVTTQYHNYRIPVRTTSCGTHNVRHIAVPDSCHLRQHDYSIGKSAEVTRIIERLRAGEPAVQIARQTGAIAGPGPGPLPLPGPAEGGGAASGASEEGST